MIIEKIGICAVLEQLSEECNELAKAALKMSRKIRNENPTPKTYSEIRNELNEEIADVQNVLSILYEESDLLDKDSINETIDYKRDRWNRRLYELEPNEILVKSWQTQNLKCLEKYKEE